MLVTSNGMMLKKCQDDCCDNHFPMHYFDDRCPKHMTAGSNRIAREKCERIFQNQGDKGLLKNLFTSFMGMGAERVQEVLAKKQ